MEFPLVLWPLCTIHFENYNEVINEICLTRLWIEDLRGEVGRRCARREMFIAVGDEGRQWVHMVGMLYHWDFIGLLKNMSRRLPVCNKWLIESPIKPLCASMK